jgi:acetyl-CoA carboxylase carboxyltransferase component
MDIEITSGIQGKLVRIVGNGNEVLAGSVVAIIDESVAMEEVQSSATASPSVLSKEEGWQKQIDEIHARRALALKQGGDRGVKRQHDAGRLTIRERVSKIIDAGSRFSEVGPISGGAERNSETGELESFTPGNFLLGFAKINQRNVIVGGEDFSISGGSPNVAGLRKSVYTEKLALQYKMPLVRLHEGSGGSIGGAKGKNSAPSYGDPVFNEPRFKSVAECLGTVPVACAALGSVAGLPASRLVSSHFSVMASDVAHILIAGPAVVERALGYSVSKKELGGAEVHARSGVVDNVVKTEAEALQQIRTFLSFMPSNVWELPPRMPSEDDVCRKEAALRTIIPNKRRAAYDMRELLELVLDRNSDGTSSFFEMGDLYGPSQIVGLARIDGMSVGVLGNDNRHHAGAMTVEGAIKTRRFLEMCQTFHIPIVNFVDQPGFMIGIDSEKAGTIRYGTAAVLTAATCTVPWATILVRKTYGVAGAAHFGPGNYVLAWPSSESGPLPIEGGVAVAFRRQIAEAENPEEFRRQLEESMAKKLPEVPFRMAEGLSVHDLIDPADTRPMLCDWVDRIGPLLESLKGPTLFTMRP